MPERTVLLGLVLAVLLAGGCSAGTAPEEPVVPAEDPSGTTSSAQPPATDAVPPPEELSDGVVAEVDGGLDGGLLFIVWDGTRERIQQPAAMDAATIEELGLRLQPPVERFVARAEPDPRTFWVVTPPDGPDAQLHLAVGPRLYPVVTVPAHRWQIDRLTEPPEPLLNRMRPAR